MATGFGQMTESERVAWEAAELERKLRLRVELKATRGIHVTVDEERARLALWNRMENWELAELKFDARGMILPESLPERLRADKEEKMAEEGKLAKKVAKLEKIADQVEVGPEPENNGTGTKTRVTMYLNDEVISMFKLAGPGWQTRINDALLTMVRSGLANV